MKLTNRKVAALVCKREGGKSESKMGDTMQQLNILWEVLAEHPLAERQDYIEAQLNKAGERLLKKERAEAKAALKEAKAFLAKRRKKK